MGTFLSQFLMQVGFFEKQEANKRSAAVKNEKAKVANITESVELFCSKVSQLDILSASDRNRRKKEFFSYFFIHCVNLSTCVFNRKSYSIQCNAVMGSERRLLEKLGFEFCCIFSSSFVCNQTLQVYTGEIVFCVVPHCFNTNDLCSFLD